MNVRELVTKFVFQGDTAKVKAFDQAVENAKQAAQKADAAVVAMGKAVEKASRATNEGARAVTSGVERMRRQVVGDTQAIAAGYDQAAKAARDFEKATRGVDGRLRGADGKFLPSGGAGGHGKGAGLPAIMGGLGHHMGKLVAGYVGFQAAEAGLEHYGEFEQNIQKAAAAMAAGSSDMNKLRTAIQEMRDKALEFSQQLGFNPRQVSEVMMEIGSKGFEHEDVNAMTPTALMLARGGMADPKVATDLLTSAIEGFYGRDKGAKKHAEVGDLLLAAHDAGGISLPSLLEEVKYAAPAAGALGQDMKSTMTLAAILGRYGLQGSMAGNGLKAMIVKLAAPATMNAKKLEHMGLEGVFEAGKPGKNGKPGKGHMGGRSVLDALGVTTTDAKHNLLPMIDIMKQVILKTAHMGTAQRAAVFKGLFGLEDIPQGMAIARAMAEDGGAAFLDVVRRMDNANGAMERMNKVMNEGLAPAWQRLKAKGEVLADLLLEKVSPSLVGLLDAASAGVDSAIALVKWLDDVTDHGRKVEPVMTAAKYALAAVFTYLTGGVVLAGIENIKKLTTALKELRLATIGVQLAWGALAIAVVLAVQDIYGYTQGDNSIFGGFIDTANGAIQRFMAQWPRLSAAIASFTNIGGTLFAGYMDIVGGFTRKSVDLLVTMFLHPAEALNAFKALVAEVWRGIADTISNTLAAINAEVKRRFGVDLKAVVDGIPGMVESAFQDTFNRAAKWIDSIIEKMKKIPGVKLLTGDGGPRPPAPAGGETREKAMPDMTGGVVPVLTSMVNPAPAPWSAPTLPPPGLAGGGGVNITTTVHVSGRSDGHETGHIVASHVNRAAASAARQMPRQKR
jgi:TP901 family phage tail tape measure protein